MPEAIAAGRLIEQLEISSSSRDQRDAAARVLNLSRQPSRSWSSQRPR